MLRVFVSSTARDLAAHREAVRKAIMELDMHPVMMEDFTATNADAVQKCKRAVEDSDVFIGIYAHRYGFIPPEQTKSITHLEYDWAVAANKPRLLYVVDERQWWPSDYRDADPLPLDKFKATAGLARVWKVFTTPENLASKVSSGLAALEREKLIPAQRRLNLALAGGVIGALLVAALIIGLLINRAATEQENLRATNAAIALSNQTATAASWTATPTPTATATASATPTATATPRLRNNTR